MSYGTPQRLRPGGDPRALPDYAKLRKELSKLTHPARLDVDWQRVETLCLSLFSQNGVELQTAAWYTLARTRLAGLDGLCEGLAVLEALLAHQWGSLWPQPVHARIEILVSLSQRLQQAMRTLTFLYTDLGKLYQAEQHLSGMGEVLQRLELKHVSQLEALRSQLHNAAVRLENSGDTGQEALHEGIVLQSGPMTESTPPAATQWVFVAQQDPAPRIVVAEEPPPSVSPWKSFTIGAFSMLVLGGAGLWGWQVFQRPDPLISQLNASLAPLPAALTEQQLASLRQKGNLSDDLVQQTQQQLNRLTLQSPVWTQQYGNQLVRQTQALWPEQSQKLAQQWQQQLNATALPAENLNGWHQGMEQLQQLSDKLNALDERKGRYLTGSELKTMVYDITRSFNRAVPVEEQLRQLAQTPQGQPVPAAQQSQTEMSLNALLNRYALTVTRPALDNVSP
ncbi:VasL domain-containing protein [Citrobacter amalonaticus]|uniref:VasL domain-containing protein n=1 Tax=Citrobacter amalonaticus TaxID=35703 RepID=UPI00300C4660